MARPVKRTAISICFLAASTAWSQPAEPVFPPDLAGEHRTSLLLAPELSPADAAIAAAYLDAESRSKGQAAPREVTLPATTIPIDIDWCRLPQLLASSLPVAIPNVVRQFQFCSANQPLTQCRSVSGGGAQVKVCGSLTEFRTRGFIRVGGRIDAAANVTPPRVDPGRLPEFSPCNRIPRIADPCSVTGLCTPGLPVLVEGAKLAVFYPCNDGYPCIAGACVPGVPLFHKGRIVTCALVRGPQPPRFETCRLVRAGVPPSVTPPTLTFNANGDRTLQAELSHTIGGGARIEIDIPMFLGVVAGTETQVGDIRFGAEGKLGFFLHLEAEAKDARLTIEANADSRATIDLDWNSLRGWVDRGRVIANTWKAGLRFEEPREIRLKEAVQATAELEFSIRGRVNNNETTFASAGLGFFTGPYLEDIWSRLPNRNFRHDIDTAFEVGAQASLKITDGGFLLPDRHLLDFQVAKDLARADILDLYGRGDLDVAVRVNGAAPGPIKARLEMIPQTLGLARYIPVVPLALENLISGSTVRFSRHPSIRDHRALCEVDAPILGGRPAVSNCELVAGDHRLTIDVPSACSVNGGNSRIVRLLPGEVVTQQVEVACGAGLVVGPPPSETKPRLIPNPSAIAFHHQAGTAPPASRTIAVLGEGTPFVATATKYYGAAWLSASPERTTTPGKVTVSVIPGALPPGDYVESIVLARSDSAGLPVEVPVSLRVTAQPALAASSKSVELEAMAGATAPLSESLSVSGPAMTVAALGGAWLTATVQSARLTVSANPTGLAEGVYDGAARLSAPGVPALDIPVTLRVRPNRLSIAQIADGDGWSTSIILVNTDKESAPFTIRFYDPNGRPLAVDLDVGGRVSEYSATIPPGGSHVVETDGSAADLTQGWAEVTAERALGGRAVFRQRLADNTGSEAAVPLIWPADGSQLLPFDNTQGFAVAVALLNSNPAAASDVSLTFRDEDGRVIARESIRLGARSREAFGLAARYGAVANRRGVVEIAASAPGLSVLGLRFNPRGSFTSFEAVAPQAHSNGTLTRSVSQVADGMGWKTTFVVVNAGTEPARFSLVFRSPSGVPLALPIAGRGSVAEIFDEIPAGGSRTVETVGSSAALLEGWAEIVSTQPLGGTTVFRQSLGENRDSEAVAQITAVGSSSFVLPFDNADGFLTAIAALNDTGAPATATVTFRDQDGVVLATETVSLAAGNRAAFALPLQYPKVAGRRGSAEFSGSDIKILGLRFNPSGAFTSFAPVRK
jgi:hypothetical protein